MMFLDCPAYLDDERDRQARSFPAEVSAGSPTAGPTDGPLDSAMIRYPAATWFNGTIGQTTWDSATSTTRASA